MDRTATAIAVALGILLIASWFGHSAEPARPPGPAAPAGYAYYQVRPGETLFRIARQHGTTVEFLAQLNRLPDPHRIKAGQLLLVPAPPASAREAFPDGPAAPGAAGSTPASAAGGSAPALVAAGSTSASAVAGSTSAPGPAAPPPPAPPSPGPDSPGPTPWPALSERAYARAAPDLPRAGSLRSSPGELRPSPGQLRQALAGLDDLDLLARIIWLEARGEPFEGQVAVGAVVLNRVQSPHFPDSVAEVLAQPGQFGFSMAEILAATPGPVAYEAAARALAGEDPTGGALFFYNPDKTRTPEFWATRPVLRRIGNHVFTR